LTPAQSRENLIALWRIPFHLIGMAASLHQADDGDKDGNLSVVS
jgi:hypothetical protein